MSAGDGEPQTRGGVTSARADFSARAIRPLLPGTLCVSTDGTTRAQSALAHRAMTPPCVLHANSAAKSALPVLQLHAERMGDSARRMRPVPMDSELVQKVDMWQAASPCWQVLRPGTMRKPAVCLSQARKFLRDMTASEPSPYEPPAKPEGTKGQVQSGIFQQRAG